MPVVVILQARVDKGLNSTAQQQQQQHQQQQQQQQSYIGPEAQTLEEVRSDWCALVGDTDATSEASTVISDVIPMILLDSPSLNMIPQKPSKIRECIDQNLDLKLSYRYSEVINRLQQPRQSDQPQHCEP